MNNIFVEDRIYHIISNQLSGHKLANDEVKELQSWLLVAEHDAIYEELRSTWELVGKNNYKMTVDTDAEWLKFKNAVIQPEKSKLKKLSIAISAVAASIIIMIGAFGILNLKKDIVYSYSPENNYFVLPDQSEVWLNKDASISFTSQFGNKLRTVNLKGEAFFKVTKSKVPFMVNTMNDVHVKVLGTQFNLKCYSSAKNIELAVVSGKVEFGNTKKKEIAIVEKGNRAVYLKDLDKITCIEGLNSNSYSWHTGLFVFDNQPMSEVVKLLQEYLEITIDLPSTVMLSNYSGKFTQPSVNDVAVILSRTYNLSYTISSDKVVFISKQQ